MPPCPSTGRYVLVKGGSLECTEHPGIMRQSWVGPLFSNLDARELASANRGLLLGQLRTQSVRYDCFRNQSRIDKVLDGLPPAEGPSRLDLERLVQSGRLEKDQCRCPVGNPYRIERDERGHWRAVCKLHGTFAAYLLAPTRKELFPPLPKRENEGRGGRR